MDRKRILHIMFSGMIICFASFSLSSQTIINEGEDLVKKNIAKQNFYGGRYVAALKIYKELASHNTQDPSLNFHIGECYLELRDVPSAIEYFEKAKKQNSTSHPELNFKLGIAYQMNEENEKALQAFADFKSTATKRMIQDTEVDRYISQCNTAKQLLLAPVGVNVTPLDEAINSKYDDKNPSVTADGKKFVFNSRRPEGKGGKLDVEGDNKYFEDVYISLWDSVNGKWGEAELVPGAINTEAHDACNSISPDGKQIFLYKNDEDEARGGDIYVSKISSSGKWGTPKNLGAPVNSSYFEAGACLAPDGKTLYFVSENSAEGMGRCDIYMSKRVSGSQWGKPVNLGPTINSENDEPGVFIAPDGKTLYFASDGPGSMGSYDIFKSVFENGKWSKPVNLGYPINTMADDRNFVLVADGKTAYLASSRKGGNGELDIYKVDMSSYSQPPVSIVKGRLVIKGEDKPADNVEINFYDETGQKVATTYTNPEGEYFITLAANKKYEIKIQHKKYQPVSEKFDLPFDKVNTAVVAKNYSLQRN